jgi:protein-tyrosine-phosphatase
MIAQTRPPIILKLLADDVRWRIVMALARSDRGGRELAKLTRRPPNLISYHLKRLLKHKLVDEHRSAADGRSVYFSLRLDDMRQLLADSGETIHPALGGAASEPGPQMQGRAAAKRQQPVRVLFLCTHNSARSQMAEGLLRHLGGADVEAFSAGTEPGSVRPEAIAVMKARGIDISKHYSKSVKDFAGQSFDYVVTVCDQAKESCPIFPGHPEQIHWSFDDPSAVTGAAARQAAFEKVAMGLTNRINFLLILIRRGQKPG